VGCSTLIGELTKEALREGKWLVISEVLREGTTSITSGLRRGESIVNWDNWDGDIGVSSGPRTFVRLFMLLTLRLIRRT